MSDLNDQYRMADDEGKLYILNWIWNNCTNTEEEKQELLQMTQKVYNRIKGRDSKQHILNLMEQSKCKENLNENYYINQ